MEWKRHWSIPSRLAGQVEAGSSPAAQSSVQDPEIEDGGTCLPADCTFEELNCLVEDEVHWLHSVFLLLLQ